MLNVQLGGRAGIRANRFGSLPFLLASSGFGVIDDRLPTSGAWLFRSARATSVPEPNAALLLLVGIMIIAVLSKKYLKYPGKYSGTPNKNIWDTQQNITLVHDISAHVHAAIPG